MHTDSERMTVAEASKVLGVTPDYVRYMMRQHSKGKNDFDIGIVVGSKGTQLRYLVFKEKVLRMIGK